MIATRFDIHPFVPTVTMERPGKRNALSAELVAGLTEEISALGTRDDIRCVVLTGSGTAFSAGADLDSLQVMQQASFEDNLDDSLRLVDLFLAILRCPVPVIARVNGPAVAGGCGLVAACDMAVSVESARFGFPEVRIGFVPAIVSVVLARRLSGTHVRDLLLTGRLVDAEQAREMGLVREVVAEGHLDAAVRELAVGIGRKTSRLAVTRTKELLDGGLPGDLEAALQEAARVNAEARSTGDCIQGIRAFLERSQAPWITLWDDAHGG